MKWTDYVLLFLALSLSVFAALDLNPPSWRDHPRSTYQFWDFSANDLTPLPDGFDTPFEPLEANIYPTSGAWLNAVNGRSGVFPLSGEIFVPVYNFSEPLDEKIIQVQLTWLAKGGSPQVEARATSQDLTVPEWTAGILVTEELLANGWKYGTYEVILRPNPPQELIHIYGEIYIDDLVIDTVCIPEPATWGILAIGAFLVRKQKRTF